MTFSNLINPDTSLGRYLTEHGHFARIKNEVKFKAFMPAPDLRLSVFMINGLKINEVWDIGQNLVMVNLPRYRKLYGVADIKANIVEREKLNIDADNNPPRHANIIGWPEDQAAQMSIAQVLAAEATLKLKE